MQIAFGNAIGLTNANLKNYVNSLKPKAWFKSTDMSAQGYSLDFDGTDDYVQADNEITAYPFTLECWVKLDVTNVSQRIFAIAETSTNNKRFGVAFSTSTEKFGILAQNTAEEFDLGTTIASANVWYHLTAVFASATSRTLYVNGASEVTATASVTFNNSANNRVELARHFDNNVLVLNGKLSDVRIWNTARTAQEIADNYNKRLIGNESGLVGYWKLDEGNATSVKDYTSNANDGTISGALWNTDEPFTENISDFTGVRVWKDISGNGYNAEQNTSANRPTYRTNQINGKPALVFDGVNDRLTLPSGALGILRNVSGATIFVVIKYSTALNLENGIHVSTNVSTVRLRIIKTNGNKFNLGGRRLDADNLQSFDSSGNNTGNFVIHSALANYQNTLLQQYINGGLDGQKTDYHTTGNTSDTNSTFIGIGSNETPSSFLNGAIAEIIIFNRALTNGELSLVHQYLKQEYDL